MTNKINLFKKYIPLLSIIFGLTALIIAQFAKLPRTEGLFTIIAIGPIINGLVAYLRYKNAENVKKTVRIIVEASWIPFSFGLGYLVMAPSSYYAANSIIMTLIVMNALILIGLGLSSLIFFGKNGYSLTP